MKLSKFKFKDYTVLESEFKINSNPEDDGELEVNVNGGALMPKDIDEGAEIGISLSINLGNDAQALYFHLKLMFAYQILDTDKSMPINEKDVKNECLKDSLRRLAEILSKILSIYGVEKIELPDFPTKE